jgi:hypothetical protein
MVLIEMICALVQSTVVWNHSCRNSHNNLSQKNETYPVQAMNLHQIIPDTLCGLSLSLLPIHLHLRILSTSHWRSDKGKEVSE